MDTEREEKRDGGRERERESEKERERERKREREGEKERERETQRETETEKEIARSEQRASASLTAATRKCFRRRAIVMKRTASLRFAELAPQWVSEMRALDRLCLLMSCGALGETSQGQKEKA